MEINQKDLEFLRDLDEKPLNLYLKGLIPVEKADILRWKTTQKVRPDEQMKFQLAVKNLRKAVPAPAPSHQPLELTPIKTEQAWIDKARNEVDFFVEYVSGKAPVRHHKIWLANIFHPDYDLVNIIAPPGSAKAQPLDAKIATPTGWRLMGDLQAGDQVISVDGCPTEILGIYPQGVKDIYRVTFTDGSSTECTDDHLWTVRLQGAKDDMAWRTVPLSLIRTKTWNNRTRTYTVSSASKPWIAPDRKFRWHIPVTDPIDYPEKEFFLSPYTIGALLGDGNFSQRSGCGFTCADSEILVRVQHELPDEYELRYVDRYDYRILYKKTAVRQKYSSLFLWRKSAGLLSIKSVDKFIPREYLLGSIAQRIALLQGLLDTDGTTSDKKNQSAVFCTISPQLRDDVVELVESLGGKCGVSTNVTTYMHKGERRFGQTSYKVTLKLPAEICPFYLPRKVSRYTPPTKYPPTRGVVDIELVGQKETQCIKVAHDSQLYLTDRFIVTHNTTLLIYALAYHMGYNPLTTNSMISVSSTQADSRMSMLKDIVTYNKAYQNVFPHICIDENKPNNTQEFSLRIKEDRLPYSDWQTLIQQKGEPHDPTFKAAGYGGKAIIGSRWSGICGIDDIVDESMLSAEIQRKVGTYILQTLLSRLVPRKGRVVAIGTRWMLGDVAQQLKENPSFRTLEFPAERFVNGERKSYWPEYWPIETLEKVAQTVGPTLYQTNYMCNPTAASMQKFTQEMLSYDLPYPLPIFTHIFISTDFALSVQQKADYTVYQAIGIDTEGNYYILDQRRYKEGPDDTPALLGLFADEVASRYGRLDDIIIESVAFSGTMGNLLRQKRSDLPFTKFVPKGDKAHRASLVADVARNHKLFINQDMQDIEQLKLEWLNFGSAPHDDTLDPMGLLLQFRGASTITATYKLVKSPFML